MSAPGMVAEVERVVDRDAEAMSGMRNVDVQPAPRMRMSTGVGAGLIIAFWLVEGQPICMYENLVEGKTSSCLPIYW